MNPRQICAMLVFIGIAAIFLLRVAYFPGYPFDIHMTEDDLIKALIEMIFDPLSWVIGIAATLVASLGSIILLFGVPSENDP